MAEEDEEMTIVTYFDLEEYNHNTDQALFKQRKPTEYLGHFHFWSMDLTDWEALKRCRHFKMTLSPHDEAVVPPPEDGTG